MDPAVESERLAHSYVHHKRIVVLWEAAIVKALGRPPNRDDLRNAPRNVHDSYARYREIKKYLDHCLKAAKESTPVKRVPVPITPRKIFTSNKVAGLVATSSLNLRRRDDQSSKQIRDTTIGSSRAKQSFPATANQKLRQTETEMQMFKKPLAKTSSVIPKKEETQRTMYKKLYAAASDLQPITSEKQSASNKNFNALDSKSTPLPLSVYTKDQTTPTKGNQADVSTTRQPNSPSPIAVSRTFPERQELGEEEVANELDLTFATGRLKRSLRSSMSSRVENSQHKEVLSVDSLATPSKTRNNRLRKVDTGWLSRCENGSGSDEEEEERTEAAPLHRTRAQSREAEAQNGNDEQMEMSIEPELSETETGINSDSGVAAIPIDFMSSFEALASISDLDQLPSVLLDSTAVDYDLENGQEILNPEILIGEDEIRELLKEINSLTRSPAKKAIHDPYWIPMEPTRAKIIKAPVSPVDPELLEPATKKRSASPSGSPVKDGPKRKFFKTSRSDVILKKTYSVQSYKPPTPVKKSRGVASRFKRISTVPVKKFMKIKNTGNDSSKKLNGNSKAKADVSDAVDESELKLKSGRVTRSRISQTKSPGETPVPEMEIHSPPPSTSRVTRSTSSTPAKAQATPPSRMNASASKPPAARPKYKVNSKAAKHVAEAKPVAASKKGPVCNEADTFDEVMTFDRNNSVKAKRRGRKPRMTNKAFLQKKVADGTLNDNYVRIDVTKKVFVRGRKKMSGTQTKKNDWKNRKSALSTEAKIKLTKCNKCGDVGHFSKFCMKDYAAKDGEPDVTDSSPFPSLEEAARMVWSKPRSYNLGTRTSVYETQQAPNAENGHDDESKENKEVSSTEGVESGPEPIESVNSTEPSNSSNSESQGTAIAVMNLAVEPVFNLREGEIEYNLADELGELQKTLKMFGHKDFRPGQQEAITRVLRGLSTLVILSTGSGKSLCYFLPAYLYAKHNPGVITLCISPLVSLMEDQVQSIPPFLHGACLHTNMTEKQREVVLEKVRNKKLNVLLVSPEAVCGGLFGLLRNAHEFPPIGFACIDEVHCVSEWSHNFRPSYLKLCKILREKLNVRTILGLTATATNHTSASICEHLQVDPSTVIRGELVPRNLRLSVSRDLDRQNALLYLLNEERFLECDSIIIYCTRREECERISSFLRTNMQESAFSGVKQSSSRSQVSTSCEAYHAGMSAARRKRVQNYFMSGTIRIVVATVAFGMGIDKSDIRAVIHYNMPKTFESYVQEIGRAGRDGLPAECHLFMDNAKGKDLCELKRHVYSNSVDRSTVRKLLSKIYKPCKCKRIEKIKGTVSDPKLEAGIQKKCGGHEVSFSVEETVKELDLPQENIETLLCYLELDSSRKWIEMMPKCYQLCTIQSYGGAKLLKAAAHTCPPLAVAIALQKERKKFKDSDLHLQFNMVEVAATVGWNSAVVRRELKRLEWSGTEFDAQGNATKFRKSGLLVEFTDLAYRLVAPGQLTDEESDTVLDLLHGRNSEQEKTQLYQLYRIHEAFESVSVPNVGMVSKSFNEAKSDHLKKVIYEYFNESGLTCPNKWKMEFSPTDLEKEDDIRQDVQRFLCSHENAEISGRSVAKIFQGISSPCFPSTDWARNKSFWRRHLDVDFHFLCRIAAQEIIRY